MKNEQHDRIRRILREGDPAAADPGLDAEEAARMRRRVLAETPAEKVPIFRPIPAFAAASIVVLVLVAGWQFRQGDVPVEPDGAKTETVGTPLPSDPERRTRQIQFSAPGGTRIIWLLDSQFEV